MSPQDVATHLGGTVDVMFVLQQQSRSLDVVLLCCDVERWQTHTPPTVVLEQHCHDLVMTLLEGDREWGETVLEIARGELEIESIGNRTGDVH